MIKVNHEFAKSNIQNGNGINHLKVLVNVENQKQNERNAPIAVNVCLDNSGSMDMRMNGGWEGITTPQTSSYIPAIGNPYTAQQPNPYATQQPNHYANQPIVNPLTSAPQTLFDNKFNNGFHNDTFVTTTTNHPKKIKRKGTKMDYAKMSTIKIVESLNENDYFGLVIFDDLAYVVVELQQIANNKKEIIKQINSIQTRGCTNMYEGLRKVEEQFNKITDLDITKKTIVLSDGQVNSGVCELGAFAEKAHQFFHKHNIGISTIGFGTDYNLELMSMLATKGEGNFYHLKDAEEIYGIMENELNIINSIVARNTTLTITIPKGFTFEENINNFDEEYVDDTVEVKFGNLYASKYIIFPIALLRKIRNKKETFVISLQYTNNDNETVEISSKTVLPISNDPTEVVKENEDIIKEVAETLQRKAILNATVEFENTGGYAVSSAFVTNNMVNLTASYSSAKEYVNEYQSSFESVLRDSSHDINELRKLNSKTMYDIKNKK